MIFIIKSFLRPTFVYFTLFKNVSCFSELYVNSFKRVFYTFNTQTRYSNPSYIHIASAYAQNSTYIAEYLGRIWTYIHLSRSKSSHSKQLLSLLKHLLFIAMVCEVRSLLEICLRRFQTLSSFAVYVELH